MLHWLSIRNFVLVETLDIEFGSGFTVLTGETGAGKSILLDAIGLVLGDRFEARQLRVGTDRADIAAGFIVAQNSPAHDWLVEHDLLDDDADALTLRRALDASGKSRAWINGHPAPLAQLAELGALLLELHGQHAHQSLSQSKAQRHWLDAYAGALPQADAVRDAWHAWRAAQQTLDDARQAQETLVAERERLTLRHDDLQALAMQDGEWEQLSSRQNQLAHAETLLTTARDGADLLSEGEMALLPQLHHLVQKLRDAGQYDPAFDALAQQIDSAAIDLSEAARTLRDAARHVDLDPETLAATEARLTAIHDLARKYRVRPEDLPTLTADTAQALARLDQATDLAALEQALADSERRYRDQAQKLSQQRRRAARELADAVTSGLAALAMPGGRFDVAVTPAAQPESQGLDHIEFGISAHPGQPLAPLAKVASGGELSRIALALLTVLARSGSVPTLIFDEIDTGVGGAVGHAIGQRLRALGGEKQVLCVTHLPQVAACAHHHYQVSKEGDDAHVKCCLAVLDPATRAEEIARMLGGATVTAKTRAHARELLDAAVS
ncbi:MAG: DNA repair protein RecN [Proteobacteria bacterium]|nr:DNA repair protein RecN [Pseudomonadota bacterium]MCL2307703.1 DNA repair protein RecN [Pseudomonadota bacterium]